MNVRDSWSEEDHPYENHVETLGMNPLKRGVAAIMDRTGAYDKV